MNNRFQKFAFILSLTALMGIFGFWMHASASEPIYLNVDNYPKIPVPEEFDQDGTKDGFFDLDCMGAGTCDFDAGDFTAIFLGFIYYTSLWLAGFIAFMSLIYAGFLYIVSGQKPGIRSTAQERITAVVLGSIILFLAVLAFTIINPDINKLKISGQNEVQPGKTEKHPEGQESSGGSGDGGGTNYDEPSARGTYSCVWLAIGPTGTCEKQDSCADGFSSPDGFCVGFSTQAECEDSKTQDLLCTSEDAGDDDVVVIEPDPNGGTFSCYWEGSSETSGDCLPELDGNSWPDCNEGYTGNTLDCYAERTKTDCENFESYCAIEAN